MNDDVIFRQAAIEAANAVWSITGDKNVAKVWDQIMKLPSVTSQRWNRLMMYLADLQLTYSPNWGANGQGDNELYEFVTDLIEELESW